MADISSIAFLNGDSYNLKDATLQSTVSTLVDKDSWLVVDSFYKDNISLQNFIPDDTPRTSQQTITVSKSGYTALGIVDVQISNASSSGVNSSWAQLTTCYLSASTTATVRINTTAQTNGTKVKVTVWVLFKKN